MTRLIKMAPGFENKKTEVEQILLHFEEEGELVHSGRNCIKTFQTALGKWNVKRYHRPSLFNRIVYSFFRQPKGMRAFLYPQKILEAGFETPRPVAYVEERQAGLIGFSYFISEHCSYSRRFYEFGDAKIEEVADIISAFTHFTASLHQAGIYHRDYSPGNILFDHCNDDWHFSIVDINRMQFGPVSIQKGCHNFARLWGQPDFFLFIADCYATERNASKEDCRHWVMEARNKFWKPREKNFDLPFHLNFYN